MRHYLPLLFCLTFLSAAERPVPPPGIEVPAADKAQLESGLKRLAASVAEGKKRFGARSNLVADVLIFHEAVRYALEYDEFLKPEEIQRAKDLLRMGQERADSLAERTPWAVSPDSW
jgi:hypothetical protein